VLWETLHELGYTGKRGGPDKHTPLNPFPWYVQKDGAVVNFSGQYEDAVDACSRFAVHVDLTAEDYTYDLLKFVTLEAMDAGCLPVIVPALAYTDKFQYIVVEGFTKPVGIGKAKRGHEQLDDVQRAVEQAIAVVNEGPLHRDLIIRHNREMLRVENNPATFVSDLVNLALM
jgi:hypothetical protein